MSSALTTRGALKAADERLRSLVSDVAHEIAAIRDMIAVAELNTHRPKPVNGKSRVTHPSPTPLQVRQIRAYKFKHQHVPDGDCGRRYGVVNHGRVSEIFRGKLDRRSGQYTPVYDAAGRRL